MISSETNRTHIVSYACNVRTATNQSDRTQPNSILMPVRTQTRPRRWWNWHVCYENSTHAFSTYYQFFRRYSVSPNCPTASYCCCESSMEFLTFVIILMYFIRPPNATCHGRGYHNSSHPIRLEGKSQTFLSN